MIEQQIELEKLRHQNQMESENKRKETQDLFNKQQRKLETLRMAKETLLENARNKPVSEREISSDDITNLANKLIDYLEK